MGIKNNYFNKLIAVVTFGLIALSAMMIIRQSVPPGPWHGIYSTFRVEWLLIFISAALLFLLPGMNKVRVIGAILLAYVVFSMTIQWGVFWGIRDPWIHQGYIIHNTYFGVNPYPGFHATIKTIAITSASNRFSLINLFPIISITLGIMLVLVIGKRLVGNDFQFGSYAALGFLPIIMIDLHERPFTIILAMFLVTVTVVLFPLHFGRKSFLIILLGISLVIWHPLAMLAFLLLIVAGFIISLLGEQSHFHEDDFRFRPIRTIVLSRASFIILASLIFISYILYATGIGPRILENIVLAYFIDSEPSTRTTGRPPLILNVLEHSGNVFFQVSLVLAGGLLSFFGVYSGTRTSIPRYLCSVCVLSTTILILLFISIDLLAVSGFAATRAIPMAEMMLLPGALAGAYELYRRIPRGGTIPLALILLIGLMTMFPSPLLGFQQGASTPSDVDRTDWLVEYDSKGPVIDSENTYEITNAIYGEEARSNLGDGSPYLYQRNTREEPKAWRVEPPISGARYVIHDLTRARMSSGELVESSAFETSSNKVYTGGNSDVYWLESSA